MAKNQFGLSYVLSRLKRSDQRYFYWALLGFFLLALLFLLYHFIIRPKYAAIPESFLAVPTPTNSVTIASGVLVQYSGTIKTVRSDSTAGIWEFKADAFPAPTAFGAAGYEPDRYEIVINKNIPHIFGLGMQSSANQVEAADFLDTSFSMGHVLDPTGKEVWDADAGRMRTPVFVLPSERMIIAYIQPVVKRLRLSRTTTQTSLILKKREDYPDGTPGTLLIVKGNSAGDMYAKYNQYLKNKNFYFKDPSWRVFGVNWEAWVELVCTPSIEKINQAVAKYQENGIDLSTITIGSGYWKPRSTTGANMDSQITNCTDLFQQKYTTTDSLETSDIRMGGINSITGLFNTLTNDKNIYPMLGMRHNIQPANATWMSNKFSPIGNIFLSNNNYFGDGFTDNVRLLNDNDQNVVNKFIQLAQAGYGPFKGIKDDEMIYADQKQRAISLGKSTTGITNIPDNLFNQRYPVYARQNNNDFVILGRNDWFSVGTDAQVGQGTTHNYNSFNGGYFNQKYRLDSALTQVASGYPHPMVGLGYGSYFGTSGTIIPLNRQKEFVRIHQLATFLPITMHSRFFWQLPTENYKTTVAYFSQLRNRLHQYAYDQAKTWYETGIPTLMKPLYIDYPDDENVYKLYAKPTTIGSAIDEYMFGNALLVRPVLTDIDNLPVYLPKGNWKSFFGSNTAYDGNQTITYQLSSPDKFDFPVFLKEKEILIIGDSRDPQRLLAEIFFVNPGQSNNYNLFYTQDNGKTVTKYILQAKQDTNGSVSLKNITNGKVIPLSLGIDGKDFWVGEICGLLDNVSCPPPLPSPTPTPTPQPSLCPLVERCSTVTLHQWVSYRASDYPTCSKVPQDSYGKSVDCTNPCTVGSDTCVCRTDNNLTKCP